MAPPWRCDGGAISGPMPIKGSPATVPTGSWKQFYVPLQTVADDFEAPAKGLSKRYARNARRTILR